MRCNQAFVTIVEALIYWETDTFSHSIQRKEVLLAAALGAIPEQYLQQITQVGGFKLIYRAVFAALELCHAVVKAVFERAVGY